MPKRSASEARGGKRPAQPTRRSKRLRSDNGNEVPTQEDPAPANTTSANSAQSSSSTNTEQDQASSITSGESLANLEQSVNLSDDEVSDDDIPLECPVPASGSIAAHLDDRIIQKIVQGRYLHLSSVLPTNKPTTKLVFNSQSGMLASTANNKRLYNFSEWLDAFLIYAYVRGSIHEKESVKMYKYIQTVKRIKDRGGNFVRYDEAFRAKHKGSPSIPWDSVDTEEMV